MYVAERKFMRDKGGDIWFREEKKAKLVSSLLRRLLNC
jgi:hypothetical protein